MAREQAGGHPSLIRGIHQRPPAARPPSAVATSPGGGSCPRPYRLAQEARFRLRFLGSRPDGRGGVQLGEDRVEVVADTVKARPPAHPETPAASPPSPTTTPSPDSASPTPSNYPASTRTPFPHTSPATKTPNSPTASIPRPTLADSSSSAAPPAPAKATPPSTPSEACWVTKTAPSATGGYSTPRVPATSTTSPNTPSPTRSSGSTNSHRSSITPTPHRSTTTSPAS